MLNINKLPAKSFLDLAGITNTKNTYIVFINF